MPEVKEKMDTSENHLRPIIKDDSEGPRRKDIEYNISFSGAIAQSTQKFKMNIRKTKNNSSRN